MILAGGQSTRLWPLARRRVPKPFLLLDGGRSLFRRAYDRIAPLVEPSRIVVVTSRHDVRWVRRQAPEIPPSQILSEDLGRDTAPAVALAAHRLRSRWGDAVMAVLPADHVIRPIGNFRRALRRACRAAARTDGLVTFGVRPRFAATGMGYIRPGARAILPGVKRVESFVEKPKEAEALRIYRSGRYLWNSGIFVWRASAVLDALRRHRPDIAVPLDRWSRTAGSRSGRVPAALLRRVPRESIDRAVLERARNVFVIPASFEWSDLGTWDAIGDWLERDARGNSGTGRRIALDSRRCVVFHPEGLTVLIGVEDLAVVRSGRVVLVCRRRSSQRVRDAVRRLRGRLDVYR